MLWIQIICLVYFEINVQNFFIDRYVAALEKNMYISPEFCIPSLCSLYLFSIPLSYSFPIRRLSFFLLKVGERIWKTFAEKYQKMYYPDNKIFNYFESMRKGWLLSICHNDHYKWMLKSVWIKKGSWGKLVLSLGDYIELGGPFSV